MDLSLLALTLDMCVPPLALLALGVMGLGIAGLIFFIFSANSGPLLIGVALLTVLAATVLIAWMRFGMQIVPLRLLLYAPFYALGKIPLYAGFLIKRQVEWVRSKRDTP
jgi:hypothetical protein